MSFVPFLPVYDVTCSAGQPVPDITGRTNERRIVERAAMMTSCQTCGAPLIQRVWNPSADGAPQWFLERYGCGSVHRWGHDARPVVACPRGGRGSNDTA